MKITRFDTVSGGSKAPHPHSGKLVFRPDTASEHNTLAGFIEDGIGQFVTDEVSTSRTFPNEGITAWVSATTADKVRETLDKIIIAFRKRMSVRVTRRSG